MQIVLATGNKGKIKEFKKLINDIEIVAFGDILGDIDIVENGNTFKENAIIKAKKIYEMLKEKEPEVEYIVISDDSGITVPALNNEPGIYSARYAGEGASDKENLNKLINNLKSKGIKRTKAFYTACIAIMYKDNVYTVHGWMHGDVIDEVRGDKGFGYDPMFLPNGYEKTLGELEADVKKEFSHRSRALQLAKKVIEVIV